MLRIDLSINHDHPMIIKTPEGRTIQIFATKARGSNCSLRVLAAREVRVYSPNLVKKLGMDCLKRWAIFSKKKSLFGLN